jgi:hypothetical protein
VRSAKLLPTAPAARDEGDTESARKLYSAAATSKSNIGQQAAVEFARLDMPDNPGRDLATAPQLGRDGRLAVLI